MGWLTILQTVIILTIRVIGSAGSTVFGINKLYKYFKQSDHPTRPYITAAAVIFNILTTLAIAPLSIHRHFNSKYKNKLKAAENKNTKASACTVFPEGLSTRGKAIYSTYNIQGSVANIFVAFSMYLGGITLARYFANLPDTDNMDKAKTASDDPNLEIAAQVVGAICAIGAFYYYRSQRLAKISENGEKAAKFIQSKHRHKLLNAELAQTISIASFSTICAAPLAFDWTDNALHSLPFLPMLNEMIKSLDVAIKVLASVSAVTSVTSSLSSDAYALYDLLKKQKSERYVEKTFLDQASVRRFVYAVGGLDTLFSTGVSTFISLMMFINVASNHEVDDYDWWTIMLAVTFTVSKMLTAWPFSTRQNFLDNVGYFHRLKGHVPYNDLDASKRSNTHNPAALEAGTAPQLNPQTTEAEIAPQLNPQTTEAEIAPQLNPQTTEAEAAPQLNPQTPSPQPAKKGSFITSASVDINSSRSYGSTSRNNNTLFGNPERSSIQDNVEEDVSNLSDDNSDDNSSSGPSYSWMPGSM